ncbi:hypothetical protein GYMLUDRAFT_250774 [Collybiopsis luxurians FD-317 M1]|uniref:Hydrophobin n=1 Tax=Collybiopsis luxurians FD-317 M1 TaxID=944289 RepID=A0A0D0BTQ0_9AGAR|nr:hypothetical protein GYMLUDRAFT_250774 [Collybiopsis luxurians FD-317 M1]
MQFSTLTFVIAALSTFSAATPSSRSSTGVSITCEVTQLPLCCGTLEQVSASSFAALAAALGIDPNAIIGLNCTPFSIITPNCQPVCCDNNNFGGIIAPNCLLPVTPILTRGV